MLQGGMQAGDLFSYIMYVGQILMAVMHVAMIMMNFQELEHLSKEYLKSWKQSRNFWNLLIKV